MCAVFVVHYHEIALKGQNRPVFLRQLQENICGATGLRKGSVRIVAGRLIVQPPLNLPLENGEKIVRALEQTFGISSFSPAALVGAEYGEIENVVSEFVHNPLQLPLTLRGRAHWNTFAIAATRGDKKFSMTSKEIEVKLGDFVREQFSKKVDLGNPDVIFYVEVFSGGAVVYTEKIPGPGGLPVGTEAKVAVLLSGGIDSPVAAHRLMKRGAPVIGVHFHSYPFASRASIDKVKEVVQILEAYSGGRSIPLYAVPLADAQKQVVQKCDERYRVLLYRRLMWRIAQEIARNAGAQALVTGESLGQVASQTIENMAAVESVLYTPHPRPLPPNAPEQSSVRGRQGEREIESGSPPLVGGVRGGGRIPLPIFRPLIGFDKQEIIEEAKRIGTYDISIQPHDDCCTLFMPSRVATRARAEDLDHEEQKMNIEQLVKFAFSKTECILI